MHQSSSIPGIIGGAGPKATTQLYLDIMTRCQQAGLVHRPAVLIASLDINLAMEERLIQTGEGVAGYWDCLLAAARQLVAGGADFLAMPCNTLHILVPDLRDEIDVPVISILDAAVKQLEDLGSRRVGFLATGATAASNLYQDALADRDIEAVEPNQEFQTELQKRILAELAQHDRQNAAGFRTAIGDYFLANGADAVLAGCTELKALLADWHHPLPVVDSLDALGSEIVRRMLASSTQSS